MMQGISVKTKTLKAIHILSIGVVILLFITVTTIPAVDPALETIGDYGSIDWVAHKLVASGTGAPPANAPNAMRAKTLAQRAAVVIAQRNLLEVVKGVHVDSTTVVEDFMAVDDTIVAKVKGVLANASVEKLQVLADGSIKVTMGMPLQGELAELLLQMAPMAVDHAYRLVSNRTATNMDQAQAHPAARDANLDKTAVSSSAASADSGTNTTLPGSPFQGSGATYTGLLIDARTTGFQPCLKPNIYGRQKLLYPGMYVDHSSAPDDGYVRFYRDMRQAQQSQRITPRPLSVKALKTADSHRSLIVRPETFDMLQPLLNEPGNFLAERRVVIVY